jgi:hypothetical protein
MHVVHVMRLYLLLVATPQYRYPAVLERREVLRLFVRSSCEAYSCSSCNACKCAHLLVLAVHV